MEQFWNNIDKLSESNGFWIIWISFIGLIVLTYIQEKKNPEK